MTNCSSGERVEAPSWANPYTLILSCFFLFIFLLVLWLHKLVFRFGFCKAMVPAYARILNAVYTLPLKVSYFLGVHGQIKLVNGGVGKLWKELCVTNFTCFLEEGGDIYCTCGVSMSCWVAKMPLATQCLFEPSNWEGIKEKVLLRWRNDTSTKHC